MLSQKSRLAVLEAIEARKNRPASEPLPGLVPALMILARCTRVGDKKKWAYEAIELWSSGWHAEHLIRGDWLSGLGISRRDNPSLAFFEIGSYSPTNPDHFAGLLCEWIRGARDLEAVSRLAEIFFVVSNDEHVSLNLAQAENFTRPYGL